MKQLFVCLRSVLLFCLCLLQSGFYCSGQSLDDQRVQLQDWIRAEEESSTPDVENLIRCKNDLGMFFMNKVITFSKQKNLMRPSNYAEPISAV